MIFTINGEYKNALTSRCWLSLLIRPLLILFLNELEHGIDGRVRGPFVLSVASGNPPDAALWLWNGCVQGCVAGNPIAGHIAQVLLVLRLGTSHGGISEGNGKNGFFKEIRKPLHLIKRRLKYDVEIYLEFYTHQIKSKTATITVGHNGHTLGFRGQYNILPHIFNVLYGRIDALDGILLTIVESCAIVGIGDEEIVSQFLGLSHIRQLGTVVQGIVNN